LEKNQATVLAPCLAAMKCPALVHPKDWCHDTVKYSRRDSLSEHAKNIPGLSHEEADMSYFVVRKSPLVGSKSMPDTTRGPLGFERLTEPAEYFRVVSSPLKSRGKLTFWGCGAAERVELTRLDRHESDKNLSFSTAQRGDMLRLAGTVKREDETGERRIEYDTVVTKITLDKFPE
jgi:ribosomal protein RSM22 (predicted rRNA methylase)